MNVGMLYGMSTYPPSSGGTVHGYQLIKELTKRGNKIISCYFDHGQNPDITKYRLRQGASFLREIDALYIRVEWQTSSVACSLLKFATLKRIPVIWELNGTPDELRYTSKTEIDVENINQKLRRWRTLCNAAICVTDEIAAYASEELELSNTIVIPNGSDPDLFPTGEKSATPTDPFRVVWIGTSSAGWHDLPMLINVARRVSQLDQTISFEIYGDPVSLSGDLPSNVRLMGVVDYDKLGAHLANAHVGIHLFKECRDGKPITGSPLKLFDYMAAGLAVITNCAGQQSDIIIKWASGIQSENNIHDLTSCLLKLSSNRPECIEMGRRGRQAIIAQYNWENVARMTEQVIYEAIQPK